MRKSWSHFSLHNHRDEWNKFFSVNSNTAGLTLQRQEGVDPEAEFTLKCLSSSLFTATESGSNVSV